MIEHTLFPHDEGELSLEPLNPATSENPQKLRLSIPPRATTPGKFRGRKPSAEAVSSRKICGSARVDTNPFSQSTTRPCPRKHTPPGIERPPSQVFFEFFQRYPRYNLVMVPSSKVHNLYRLIQISIIFPTATYHRHYHHHHRLHDKTFVFACTYYVRGKVRGGAYRSYRRKAGNWEDFPILFIGVCPTVGAHWLWEMAVMRGSTLGTRDT